MKNKETIFSPIELQRKSKDAYAQKIIPQFTIYYELKDSYALLKATIKLKDCEYTTEKTIDLGSLTEIYEMINRKADNFRQIDKMIRRDKTGIYSLEDFIRGRIGEIYGDMCVSAVLKKLPEIYSNKRGIVNYTVSKIDEYTTPHFILKKKNNQLSQGNYYLYYIDNGKEDYQNLKGEFDFAYLVNIEYDSKEEKILVLGESKTGSVKINEGVLKKNIKRLLSAKDNHIAYFIVAPEDENKVQKQIYSIYEKVIYKIKSENPRFYDRIHFIPAYFLSPQENKKVQHYFRSLSKKMVQEILRMLNEAQIHLFIEIGKYNREHPHPHKDKVMFMRKIDLERLIEDAKKLTYQEIERKYGNRFFIPVIG